MDTQKEDGQQADGYGDESLNTSSAGDSNTSSGEGDKGHKHGKGGIHNNALFAASMGRPATAQVDPHRNHDPAQIGTNTSYEGTSSPGAGVSTGVRYTSGQAGTGASTQADSDEAQTGVS